MRELQSDSDDIDSSDIDEIVGRRIVGFEEKKRENERNKTRVGIAFFVRSPIRRPTSKTTNEGKTVALETTSVTARITQKWVRSW